MRYRRGWYRGYRHKWRGRRRGPGILRRWFHRRSRVRRRTRGRRRYKKRQYITPVMQWMPKQRVLCKIKGWTYAITCSTTQLAGRAGDTTTKPTFEYKPNMGCCNILTLSLKFFYWEWKHFRNTWSASNEGYDLARYFGTIFKLYPHPTVDYAVWWDTEYGGYTIDDLRHLQPAVTILEKNHIIVRSRRRGGNKPLKLKLHPPSTQDTNWYFQNRWCEVGVARVGFTLINFQKPLVHTQRQNLNFFIGWTSKTPEGKLSGFGNAAAPPDYTTKVTSITQQMLTSGDAIKVYYRPDMDTGDDNMVKVYMKLNDGSYASYIVYANIPYYVWFYGWRYGDISTLGLPPGKTVQGITTQMVFWWYDYDGSDTYNFKAKSKKWIVMSTTEVPGNWNNVATGGIGAMMFLTTMGPFATSDKDMMYLDRDTDTLNQNISITTKYTSYWQWGGQTMHSGKDIRDPCPGNIVRTVQVTDPATTHETTLHPWDMDPSGLITRDKLMQLIAPSREDNKAMDTDTQAQKDGEEEETTDFSDSSSDWPPSDEEELSEDGGLTQTRRKAEIAASRARHERQRRKQYQRRLRAWLQKL
ncbi:hypothetical protein QKL48_gp3 [Paguma larvata torque teno virus]|uniref:Capsid protein n=1 Tax=Paguma larvata torque teno virus TaxID=2219036 RepID=A0A348BSQ4_9VIRU|nr:hypothetical protein QKL48_gp3 [Paguma larvata torque teno virus]BBE36941.1 hypothetical protein [Paguma larvata torque teno virus]